MQISLKKSIFDLKCAPYAKYRKKYTSSILSQLSGTLQLYASVYYVYVFRHGINYIMKCAFKIDFFVHAIVLPMHVCIVYAAVVCIQYSETIVGEIRSLY